MVLGLAELHGMCGRYMSLLMEGCVNFHSPPTPFLPCLLCPCVSPLFPASPPAPPQILEFHHKRTAARGQMHPQLPSLLHRLSQSSGAPVGGGGGSSGGGGGADSAPGSRQGSRPGTPRTAGGGGSKQGSFGRRAGMLDQLLKSQSQAAWSDGGAGGGESALPTAASGFAGAPSGLGAAPGAAGSGSGDLLSNSLPLSDARSSLDSRQNSMSRRGRGEPVRRYAPAAAGMFD